MKDNLTQVWALDSPKMCRDFIKRLRMGPKGAQITHFDLANGTRVKVEDATDDQIVQLANMIAEQMMEAPPKG